MKLSVIYIVLGLILIANFLLMATVSNFHFGLMMSFLIGAYLVGWGVLLRCSACGKFIRIWKWIHRVFLVGISYLLAVALFLGFYGNSDTVDYQEDALIVLGAAVHKETVSLPLKFRLECAAEYAKKNPDAVIVVSGGKGAQEDITEALAMERYLKNRGVTNPIIKEERATSTYENFVYSKEILDSRLETAYRVAFVTNDFNSYRSEQMAEKTGFASVTRMHAETAWYNIFHNYLRETLAVTKLWVFGRNDLSN